MNLIYNYLVHCLLLLSSKILFIIVLISYSYYLTLPPLSLPLSSSPALSLSLLLPPCHHYHYNYRYWYIFVTQPITIFPQTSKYRLRNSGYSGYPIIFYLDFFFVLVCLVRRCPSLTAPQFGHIHPYICSLDPISETVCYLECRHGFQSNGGVNVLKCGKNGKWNQNVSSILQCTGTSFFFLLFRLLEPE